MFGSGEKRRSSSPDRGDTRKRLRPYDSARSSHGETFEGRARYYLPFHAHLDERVAPSGPEGAFSDQMIQEQQGRRNQDTQAGLSRPDSPPFSTHLQELEKRLFLDESLNPQQADEIHASEHLKAWEKSLQDELSRHPQQDPPVALQGEPDRASASNVEQVDEEKYQKIVEQLINPPSKRKKMPRMNEKEFGRIMEILEEKRNKGEINNEKYDICKKKMKQKIRNMKHYKDNKDAIKAKGAQYRKDNKDTIKAKGTQYRKDNKEAIRARHANYYKDNKDAIRSYKANYYKDNKYVIRGSQANYYKDNKDIIISHKANYYKDNKDVIRSYQANYYKDNKDVILAKNAEKRVHLYQEALQKATNEIVALEQEITSLQQQPCLFLDNNQLLAEKQRLLRRHHTSKERYEKALARDLEKAERLIQIRQELDGLIGREAPSHRDLQESLPNAAEESSSHHATQETRPFEERYHHWLAHPSHDAHIIATAQQLYGEYRELQRHFEEDLEPLLADFA
jgi:hypothetical protein